MKRLKLFMWNTCILVITAFFVRGISMFFQVYISNRIGSEGIGVFSLLSSLTIFVVTFANSGIYLSATRLVSESLAKGKTVRAYHVIQKCMRYSLFFGILAAILLISSASYIVYFLLHSQISAISLYVIAFSLPFTSLITSLEGYFVAVKKVSKNSLNQILGVLLKIGISIFLLGKMTSFSIDSACISLMIAHTLSEAVSFVYLYFCYYRNKQKNSLSISNSSKDTHGILKQIMHISFPVAITSYIRSGLSTVKQMLIPIRLEKSGLSCEEAISSYGIIQGMVMPVLLFPSILIRSFSSLLIPEFARYRVKKDYLRMQQVISIIFQTTCFFSIGTLGIFFLFSNTISILLYQGANIGKFLLLLCPCICFIYLDDMIDAILKGLDEQLNVMYCNILDLVVSIFCIYFLIPLYGIYGYIMVIMISEILNFSISLIQLYKATHFSFSLRNNLIIPILSLLITVFLVYFFPISTLSWWYFIMFAFLFFILYAFFYFLFSYFFSILSSNR